LVVTEEGAEGVGLGVWLHFFLAVVRSESRSRSGAEYRVFGVRPIVASGQGA
jgi:hypothetical protein